MKKILICLTLIICTFFVSACTKDDSVNNSVGELPPHRMEGNIVEINPKEKYISMEVTNVVFGYGKSKVKSGDIIYFDFS